MKKHAALALPYIRRTRWPRNLRRSPGECSSTSGRENSKGFMRQAQNANGTKQRKRGNNKVEVSKALAALKPLYGQDNVEIITTDGNRVRGIVRSMKTTQALTTPSLKMEVADGEIVKIPFSSITEIIDHNVTSTPK